MTLGIDCGITGAIACLDGRGQVISVTDLPICVNGKIKWIDGMELLEIIRAAKRDSGATMAQAFVERTQAMPKLGVISASSKGLTLGSTLSALQIAGVSTELVLPQAWKKAEGLLMAGASDKDKKAASLTKARMLFPGADLDRVKDHNRAEALLIAHWGMRQLSVKAAA